MINAAGKTENVLAPVAGKAETRAADAWKYARQVHWKGRISWFTIRISVSIAVFV